MPVPDGLRLTHVGICVSDLVRAVDFYVHALGFVEVNRLQFADAVTARILGVEDIDVDLVYLERDGFRIELLGFRTPAVDSAVTVRPIPVTGFTHLSFAVDDVAAATAAIEEWGGRVLAETMVQFSCGNKGVMTVDPDGTRVELIEVRPA